MTPNELMALEPVAILKGLDAFKMIKGEIHDHLPEVFPNTYYSDDDWWKLSKEDNRIMVKLLSTGDTVVGILYYAHLPVMIVEHDVFTNEDRYVLDAKYFEMMVTYLKELGDRVCPEDCPFIFDMDDELGIDI